MKKQEVLRGSFSAFIHMNCFSTNKLDPLTFNKHEILEMEKSAIPFLRCDKIARAFSGKHSWK